MIHPCLSILIVAITVSLIGIKSLLSKLHIPTILYLIEIISDCDIVFDISSGKIALQRLLCNVVYSLYENYASAEFYKAAIHLTLCKYLSFVYQY